MKRIILHWTAGKYKPNQCDLEHYHYLVGADGEVYTGKFRVEDNEVCTKNDYAMHTGGGNTGSIGVSMCAMLGFQNEHKAGEYPITPVQFERTLKLCAELLKKYNITLTPVTLMTHYEFGQAHPKTTSYGKIDIIYLPPYPWVKKEEVGGFIRSKVRWYLEKL